MRLQPLGGLSLDGKQESCGTVAQRKDFALWNEEELVLNSATFPLSDLRELNL